MLLLVALALFAAQAINFAWLLQERRSVRFEQAVGPAAARITDALEREAAGRPLLPDRGHVRRLGADPIDPALPRRTDIAEGLSRALAEAGVKVGRVDTGIGPVDPKAPWLRSVPRAARARMRQEMSELRVAVEQPGRGWLYQAEPWRRPDRALIIRLIIQTVILYIVVLLPVLLGARRITLPLRALAHAARAFTPGTTDTPLVEQGPPDVRAVVSAFNALRLRVSAMLDEKDRMLGAIGHDLRTPLAALRVRVESVEDDTDRARMVETIADMNHTLDDILSLARLGRPSEPVTEVDISALVDAVCEDFRDLGAEIAFEDGPRLPMPLRPSLIRRAVRNLLENAIKYGGATEVSVRDRGAAVEIVVADRGPGIPEARLAEVFEPFTRLEGSRNRDTGGIGLGLALARAIVREAGGEIRLANRGGGGLAATLVLPRRPLAA